VAEVFLTSDQHFGHRNVIRYCDRPFADLDEMHEAMVSRWNETVSPADRVYVLGDFALGRRWLSEILPRLVGEKHLIVGNHDECHPAIAKTPTKIANRTQTYLDAGFASVQLELHLAAGPDPRGIRLHHMPYRGDHGEVQRYAQWRPVDDGMWLFHGHVHEKWKQRERQINVGVDQWDFRPVALEELLRIVEEGDS
jgi:calcineurin-like phosphoesterase family protein